jgi:hypothetical protein
MPWSTLPTVANGQLITSSWGNTVGDNLSYLKGLDGAVTIDNSVTVLGFLTVTGGLSGHPYLFESWPTSQDVTIRAGRYACLTAQQSASLEVNAYFDGTNAQRFDTTSPAAALSLGSGMFGFYTAPAGANPISWTQRMAIFSSGGVGIGNVSDPGAGNLAVQGYVFSRTGLTVAPPSGQPYIDMRNQLSDGYGLVRLGRAASAVNYALGILSFWNFQGDYRLGAAVEAAVDSGTVGPGSVPTKVLIRCAPNGSALTEGGLDGIVATFYASGGVGIGNVGDPGAGNLAVQGTITQGSDVRIKRRIRTILGGLDQVRRLRPVRYQLKDGSDPRDRFGLVAQELEQEIPELVHGEDMKSINYIGLIPLIIAAIQELAAQLDRRAA